MAGGGVPELHLRAGVARRSPTVGAGVAATCPQVSRAPQVGTPTSLEGDRRQVERDQEVLEQVLDHTDLIVQPVIALEQV
jgi:hypothetical protein